MLHRKPGQTFRKFIQMYKDNDVNELLSIIWDDTGDYF